VTQAAVFVWGADRVGVRISSSGKYGSMSDSNPLAIFGYVAIQIDRVGFDYLDVVEPRIKGIEEIVHGQAAFAA
jgi:N-ethylmaleimide reductase